MRPFPDDNPTADPRPWACPPLPFLAMAAAWLIAIGIASRGLPASTAFVGVMLLVCGAPIFLAGLHASTMRRQFKLVLFQERGWIHAWLTRRLLRTLFWITWALVMSFALLLRFYVYGLLEWLVLAAAVPAFAVVFALLRRRLSAELRPAVASTWALAGSRWICTALMLVLYVGLLWYWGDLPQYTSLDQAIAEYEGARACRSRKRTSW